MGSPYDLNSYSYSLPDSLIAQKPMAPRDASRLLVVDQSSGKWEHHIFSDLPKILDSNDVLVVNNSRVLKARLLGHRLRLEKGSWVRGGKVEFLLLQELRPRVWEGLFHSSTKHKAGVRFEIPTPDGGSLRGELIQSESESEFGTVVAEFEQDPVASGAGLIPLPPYIRRSHLGSSFEEDENSYQTLFAKYSGSAAAPTAGLHFTDRLIKELQEKGIGWQEITLHVGLGTFRPVKNRDVTQHKMHEEWYQISKETAEGLNSAKKSGKRIVAVGTTSVRALESAWQENGFLKEGSGKTSLFIRPGAFKFQRVDRVITNFHLPKSTLLMLVCAFADRDLILAAYEEAIREKYRFFSYGDAMLIL